jgi:hypothetical protein
MFVVMVTQGLSHSTAGREFTELQSKLSSNGRNCNSMNEVAAPSGGWCTK